MLYMRPILSALMVVTSFTSSASAETTEVRPLAASELQDLLIGSRITQPDRQPSYARVPEDFLRDGTHIFHADNYEGRGRYYVRDNSVCVNHERRREICRHVMIDQQGQYWISKRNGQPGLIRISVFPIPD